MLSLIFKTIIIGFIISISLSPSLSSAEDHYCFYYAGDMYNVNPQLLWSISKVESNHNPKAVNKNKNGTYDYCHMQINSSWLKKIGHERWKALNNPCYCTLIGAWVLANCIQEYGYTWNAVGCYHSKNKERRSSYANKIAAIIINQGNPKNKSNPNATSKY